MPAVLFPAEAAAAGPLLALGLQGFIREGPALPAGPCSTPTSCSSSSSTDGDLDFQSPDGSRGRRPGKGELPGLRLRVDLGKGGGSPRTVASSAPRRVPVHGVGGRAGRPDREMQDLFSWERLS